MIQIKNLSFRYNSKVELFHNISLTIEKGRIYGLLGKNGAGKSSLMRQMCGLLAPTEGGILVNGFEPKRREPSFLQTICFVPEQVFVPNLKIEQYIELYAPFYPRFDKAAFKQHLQAFEVQGNSKLTALSFGQQKKIVLAFALASGADVLLLDEPTNGLDIPAKSQFRKLLAASLTEEKIVLISTHQIKDLDNLIDEVIILEGGEVVVKASLEEIAEKLQFEWIMDISSVENILYQEASMLGYAIVRRNTEGGISKVQLESFFNATMLNPLEIQLIFKS